MTEPEFSQRWVGGKLKRNRRPLASLACPDCGGDVIKPALTPQPDGVLEIEARCPGCGWHATVADL